MSESTYLFIDGAYFRKVADDYMQQMFGLPAEINYLKLRNAASSVKRMFYYDCLNDIQKNGESATEFSTRVQEQQNFFDSIQSLQGFHVRLGSLSGIRRKIRQKKVDVLLAVEALDHAFRKNMDQICLIAGDLDFAPLVDSLIRLGTYVQIMYQPRSAARELYAAADIGHPITLNHIHGWSTDDFQRLHPIPHSVSGMQPPTSTPSKVGLAKNKRIELHRLYSRYYLYLPSWDQYSLQVEFEGDHSSLERYFSIVYAPIEWNGQ